MRDTIKGPPGVSLPVSLFPPTSAFSWGIWYTNEGQTYPSADRPRPLPSEGEGRGVQKKGTLPPTSRAYKPEGGTIPQARPDPAPPALEGRSQVPPAWADSSARLPEKGEGGDSEGASAGRADWAAQPGQDPPCRKGKDRKPRRGAAPLLAGLDDRPLSGRGCHKTHYRTLTTEGLPGQPFSPGGGHPPSIRAHFRLESLGRSRSSPRRRELDDRRIGRGGAASPAGRPGGLSGSPRKIFTFTKARPGRDRPWPPGPLRGRRIG